MRVLSHRLFEYSRGYETIIHLNEQLHQEWDSKLIALDIKVQQVQKEEFDKWQAKEQAWQEKEHEKDRLFASQHSEWQKRTEPLKQEYQKKLDNWQNDFKGKKIRESICLIMAIIGLLLALTGLLFCTGVIVALVCGALWVSFHNKRVELEKLKPDPVNIEEEPQRQQAEPRPVVPPRPTFVKPIFSLVEEWWNYIEAEPTPARRHGDEGEQALHQTLGDHLPDEFVAVRQLMVSVNIDIDVLVLGPNGIWIFESKYWSGIVSLHNGAWSRKKEYFEAGGIESVKEDRNIKSFDEEWLYEEENVRNRLTHGFRDQSIAEMIKGGIVFTHPNVQLDIDASCKVDYGKTNEWIERIKNSPAISDFTMIKILNMVDQLMIYAAPLEGIKPTSANVIAETVYSKNKQLLEMYHNRVSAFLDEVKR